jgi:hypothetical protein
MLLCTLGAVVGVGCGLATLSIVDLEGRQLNLPENRRALFQKNVRYLRGANS